MVTSCSTYGIVNLERPGKGISDLAGSGFAHISLDLRLACSGSELEHLWQKRKPNEEPRRCSFAENPAKMAECFEAMLRQCRQKNLAVSIVRAPYLERNTKRTDLNDYLLQIMEESIRLCGEIGSPYLVVPPLFSGVAKEEIWQVNREYYLHLGRIAQENNVILLLENQCMDVNGHLIRGICTDGREAVEWIDRLNEEIGTERFGFCMDAGACAICRQDIHEFALKLGNRIKAVIIRDCDGSHEDALFPFTSGRGGSSQTDWLNLIRGLREIGFDGQLVFDFSYTAASFSLLLRQQLLVFAKSVADFVKWQLEMEFVLKKYEHIVLFGAGNMCRNYMKCYGEKYPPLFTCDNNSKTWGTLFCGLEVKPPEALKELPKDCAIFICNIYYTEIKEQLREMGLTNPIEFFNDEYMPSFYFDRLKMS